MAAETQTDRGHGHGDAGGGGGGHVRRRADHGEPHEEPHEGAPEWLISFADNVTLMMGFFVILFALNQNPTARTTGGTTEEAGAPAADVSTHMLDLIIAVREAFHNPVSLESKDPKDRILIQRLLDLAGKGKSKTPGIEGGDEEATATRPSQFHSQAGVIRFSDNLAVLSPDARRLVAQIAQKVRGTNLIIEIRGNAGASEALDSSDRAMRLAMERALAVAQALAEQEIDWRQMRLVGCADNDRLTRFPSSREDDRANARVEVVITDEVVPEEVPTDPSTAQQSAAWTE